MRDFLSRFGQLSERQFNRAVLLVMAFGFFALVVAGVGAGWLTMRSQQHTAAVNHTYEVERAINRFRLHLERMEVSRRGYILRPERRFVEVFEQSSGALAPDLVTLATLTADNGAQQRRVAQLRVQIGEIIRLATRSVEAVTAGRHAEALALFRSDSSVDRVRAVRRINEAMLVEENGLLAIRDAEQRASVRAFFIVLGISAVLLLAVALFSLLLIRRYTTALSASHNALRQMNESLEDAVRERTANLQRANDEIQRFAYIVSHDLRSPLVNVLGFTAELDAALKPLDALIVRADEAAPGLVDDNARLAVREDVPEAIGFIRSSTQKMDRLINAILKLSREGRRTIMPESLGMTDIVQTVADSLRHRTDELGAEITVGALPRIASDRIAVEQIFSNLVENAVKYLEPGRPGRITVRGTVIGPRAIFEVQDNGRGIDPKDHDRVFDLFRRSGAQDQPGEGIGLAHVRALAYRLGGVVDCTSALGEGATFRLSLPLSYSEEQRVLP